MDPLMILRIAELAIGLVKNATSGKVNTIMTDIQALEQIGVAVAQQYQSMAGKPLDLSLLTYEEPLP